MMNFITHFLRQNRKWTRPPKFVSCFEALRRWAELYPNMKEIWHPSFMEIKGTPRYLTGGEPWWSPDILVSEAALFDVYTSTREVYFGNIQLQATQQIKIFDSTIDVPTREGWTTCEYDRMGHQQKLGQFQSSASWMMTHLPLYGLGVQYFAY